MLPSRRLHAADTTTRFASAGQSNVCASGLQIVTVFLSLYLQAASQRDSGVPAEELARRAEHMRRQRDALLAKKKSEREAVLQRHVSVRRAALYLE